MNSAGYGAEPRTEYHRMRFSVSSSAASPSSKSSAADFSAQRPAAPVRKPGKMFISSSGTLFGTHSYGVRSGSAIKQLRIGVADRSSWFIGGSPSASSIDFTRPVWLYAVWSTNFRFV